MGTGAEKVLLGGGLGALGGALSDDPAQLTSFIGQTGNSGVRVNPDGTFTSDPNAQRTIDPGDLLAFGLGKIDQLFPQFEEIANSPIRLGPSAAIQQVPQIAGGALPFPVGISVSDPALSDPSQLVPFSERSPLGGIADNAVIGRGRTPPARDTPPGGTPPGGFPPSSPPTTGKPPPDRFAAVQADPMAQTSSMFGLPTPRGEFDKFLDAMNMLSIGQSKPIVPGGLT